MRPPTPIYQLISVVAVAGSIKNQQAYFISGARSQKPGPQAQALGLCLGLGLSHALAMALALALALA